MRTCCVCLPTHIITKHISELLFWLKTWLRRSEAEIAVVASLCFDVSAMATCEVLCHGWFLSPGQPTRSMSLVQKDEELQIVWNAKVSPASCHGRHEFLPIGDADGNEGTSSGLVLVFHASGSNCRHLVAKMMFSEGFGVWRDSNRNEIFIANQFLEHPQKDIAANNFKAEDAMVRKLQQGTENTANAKLVLKWFHPGSLPTYVLLRKDTKVQYVFALASLDACKPHGWWGWNADNELLTVHFHHKANTDKDGFPVAAFTCFQKIPMDDNTTTQYFRAIGGESEAQVKKRLSGEAFGGDEVVKLDESPWLLKNYHIVAHTVWVASK